MNDIDSMLTEAGRRMRAGAPGTVATTDALDLVRARDARADHTPRRWPVYVGGGLAAAALVGVLATTVVDRHEAIRTVPAAPADTPANTVVDTGPPSTDGAPSTSVPGDAGTSLGPDFFISAATFDGDCFELTLSTSRPEKPLGNVTGCVPEVGNGLLFARLDAAVYHFGITERDVSTWAVDEHDDRGIECGVSAILDTLPAGEAYEQIVCAAQGDPSRPATILRATGSAPDDPAAGATFVTPLLSDEQVPLDEITVDGLPDGTLTYFDMQHSCLEVIADDRYPWRSICGLQPERGALIMLDDAHFQIDRTGDEFIATELVDAVAPLTNGCTAVDGREISEFILTGNPMAAISEIRCLGSRGLDDLDGARASVQIASVLNQSGPHDGLQVALGRSSGQWSVTDMGTAVGDFAPNPIPTYQRWSNLSSGTSPSLAQVGLSWSGEPATLDE